MTGRRLLVVTSVHRPDDPRIRTKLIPSLEDEWDITFAARDPGPTDRRGLEWRRLGGGRLRRALTASRLILQKRWELVAVHDPELLPAALIRSRLGRAVVFDLHENLPAQILHKTRIPRPFRRWLAGLAGRMLHRAEKEMVITLAETGYQTLFRRSHPVIANHLAVDQLPDPVPDGRFLAYLGDITEVRGCLLAIDAAAGAELPLVMVGRIAPPEFRASLVRHAAQLGVDLDLAGELAHDQALARIGGATAGLSPLLDLPNYRHSLPTKVLEYLALGLVVVTSDLPGTTEVIGDLEGVVTVTPGDRQAWRQAGARVAKDPSLRAATQSQVGAVRSRFTWPAPLVTTTYTQAISAFYDQNGTDLDRFV